jgi:phosphatidylserine decarboxylase
MSFSVIDSLKKTLAVKPHPAGLPFILGGAAATIIFMMFSGGLATVGLIFTLFCLYFFRDPERVTPQKSSLVIAPADGIVSAIDEDVSLPAEMEGDTRYTRISTFLSVLDVHVNRSPLSGKVLRKVYKPGKFFNADLDKASEENERCSLLMETDEGIKFCVVQIAGLIARRIVNQADEGSSFAAGSRFGIIRFGSRVDVYIPHGIAPLVCVGQRAVGGETVLADIENKEAARKGAIV